MSESAIFAAAVRQPTPAERTAYLDGACRDNPDLRRRVEDLLRQHDAGGSFLEPASAGTGAYVPSEVPEPAVGSVFAGRYKLRQKLGEGGMGTVFVADQTEPVQRRVALKIIRTGLDPERMLARFEQERQALALMDHPHIAKVFDAGIASEPGGSSPRSGTPYFAMELIKGVPITKYCDDARLTPRQRLELFIPVCQAVQHAHQKGVIHRDLKPSNILVGLYDGKPVPKVIDFGVAKVTGPRLTAHSVYTEVGQMVGTLEYMAPEQAELNNLDIDTRSDIYALGVVLYELLTGTVPFSRRELQSVAFAEMLRLIKEVEPPKPSTRLSGSGTLPSVAAQRGLEPRKLTALLKGDLDWIVMKALEKDRTRRYETANGLARDIQRYLTDEPVEARPATAPYRLRKMIRRNKAAAAAAAVVAAALVLGTTISTWQAIRATRSERLAAERLVEVQGERDRANTERDWATKAEAEAKEQTAIAQAVSNFLQNDLLAQANPNFEPDRDLKVRTLLDRAAQKIEGKFNQQPQIEGYIRYTLAETYVALTLFAAAQPQIERALELCRRHLGEEHPHTLTCMYRLATVLREQNKYAEAEALYRKALELQCRVLGEEHLSTASTMDGLAYLLHTQNKLAEAEPLYHKVLAIRRRVFGEEQLHTLESLLKIAQVLQRQGKLSAAEAESAHRRVLEARRREQGNEHPDTLLATINLAWQLLGNGKLEEAERLSREGLESARWVLGQEHHRTLLLMRVLGAVLRARGDDAAAEPLLVKNLEIRRRVSGEEHRHTLNAMTGLAELYEKQKKYDRAELLRFERVELARRMRDPEHPELAQALAYLGACLLQQQKFTEAEPVLRECLAIRQKKLPDDWPTPNTKWLLGRALLGQKKYTEAEPLLVQGYEGLKQREASIPPQWRDRPTLALRTLVQLYEATGKPADAAKWQQALEAAKKP